VLPEFEKKSFILMWVSIIIVLKRSSKTTKLFVFFTLKKKTDRQKKISEKP